MPPRTRRAVTFTAPCTADVVDEPLPDCGPDQVVVATELSAVSPGTELLVYRDDVPTNLAADTSIEALSGGVSYPISYGYAAVGRVTHVGADVNETWEGQRVFSFQPHVSHFVASPDALVCLPDDVESVDATLIPNVETAMSLVMDARPMIGETAVVFGQGIVGLLTTALLADFPVDVLTVEPDPERRALSSDWGADRSFAACTDALREALHLRSADPIPAGEGEGGDAEYEGADLVVEVSGQPEGLNDALSVAGYDARIIVGSWYGTKKSPLDLGGRFHRSRVQIKASQVSTLDPDLRGRWTKGRRMHRVLDRLPSLRPSKLAGTPTPVNQAPDVYEKLADGAGLLQPLFYYA